MDGAFDIAIKNRNILKTFLETCTLEELNKVPKGFNNNIIWNIAHTIVTQQLLVYNLSAVPMFVSDDLVNRYRKGTKPEGAVTQSEVERIKGLLFTTDRKSTRLNSSHVRISYAVFCLKKK